MREQVQVAAATVIVFVAGLLIGVWTQRTQPVPPPPIPVMGEFAVGGPGSMGGAVIKGPVAEVGPGPGGAGRFWVSTGPGTIPMLPPPFGPPPPPMGPAQARLALETLMPRIRAFQDKVGSIEDQFRASLEQILRPDQRQKLAEFPESRVSPGGVFPGCVEPGPFFITMIVYRPLFDNLTRQLNLDAAQQQQLKQLLIERRNRLIALVDDTPPPTLVMGRIAALPPGPVAHP